MRFFFIFFAVDVLIIKKYCFMTLSGTNCADNKDNEGIKNETVCNSSKIHISEFTDPQTGENIFIDIQEAEPTDNNRNKMLTKIELNDDRHMLSEGDQKEVINGRSNMINRLEEKLEQDGLLMDEYSLDTDRQNRNSTLDRVMDSRKHFFNEEKPELLPPVDDISTPASFGYVNVTTSLVNSLSSPSIETYLIAATSVIFLMAAIIIVFGVWKWRWLGRQQRINNDKRSVHQNHV